MGDETHVRTQPTNIMNMKIIFAIALVFAAVACAHDADFSETTNPENEQLESVAVAESAGTQAQWGRRRRRRWIHVARERVKKSFEKLHKKVSEGKKKVQKRKERSPRKFKRRKRKSTRSMLQRGKLKNAVTRRRDTRSAWSLLKSTRKNKPERKRPTKTRRSKCAGSTHTTRKPSVRHTPSVGTPTVQKADAQAGRDADL